MELIPKATGKYRSDYNRCLKRHWKMELLDGVIGKLCCGRLLDDKYYDHPLSGDWDNCRECHIKGDWVLIYRVDGRSLILRRTGSHSDVFK